MTRMKDMEILSPEFMSPDEEEKYLSCDLKSEFECICPKCGKRHTMQLHWTGDFTPRKYCRQCRNHVD
jgi:hypothetical protein